MRRNDSLLNGRFTVCKAGQRFCLEQPQCNNSQMVHPATGKFGPLSPVVDRTETLLEFALGFR